jgi:hypothetical protein
MCWTINILIVDCLTQFILLQLHFTIDQQLVFCPEILEISDRRDVLLFPE